MRGHTLLIILIFLATCLQFQGDAEAAGVQKEHCCKSCLCTRSIPPQCRCGDTGPSCAGSCERCMCTKSNPPTCRCVDIKDHCNPPQCPPNNTPIPS